ncbi:MAG: cobalamin B12-binding domain-containing protein [Hyphomicrobiales bacterium]|nr:cobalamin B12-binding domain-containing protein [Hyphomicrobiales bacterium]
MGSYQPFSGEKAGEDASPNAVPTTCETEGIDKSKLSKHAMALLNRTIEVEIIPRLMLAHGGAVSPPRPAREYSFDAADVEELTEIVRRESASQTFAHVRERVRAGASVEAVLLTLLAPCARRLGEMWEADECTFADVTIALSRLQQVLRQLCPRENAEMAALNFGKRALLACAPGDQHSFGMFMVEEFFRRAGWDVWCAPPASADELARIVHAEWFAVVGISAHSEVLLDKLKICIQTIRAASLNKSLVIMAGGSLFEDRPELVDLIGADAMARDGRHAVIEAERLIGVASSPPGEATLI